MEFLINDNVLEKFTGEKDIEDVVVPDGVRVIKEYAFEDCTLKSITIPESVSIIEIYAFKNCTKLKNIYVSENNKYYTSVDGILFSKDKKRLLHFPFMNRDDKKYTIPDTVEKIRIGAFENIRVRKNYYNIEIVSPVERLTVYDNKSLSEQSLLNCGAIKYLTVKGKKFSITIYQPDSIFNRERTIDKRNQESIASFICADVDEKDYHLYYIKNYNSKVPLALFAAVEHDSIYAKKYLKNNTIKILRTIIDENNAENLTAFLTIDTLSKRNIDNYIKYAIEKKRPEMQVILSNYKNDKIGFSASLDKFLL